MGMFARTYFKANGINHQKTVDPSLEPHTTPTVPCDQVLAVIALACRWSAGDFGDSRLGC